MIGRPSLFRSKLRAFRLSQLDMDLLEEAKRMAWELSLDLGGIYNTMKKNRTTVLRAAILFLHDDLRRRLEEAKADLAEGKTPKPTKPHRRKEK